MKNSRSRATMLPAIDKARPLTLQEVLRLRDGLEVVRGNISGYPLQVILPNYNRKELMVLCKN